MKTLCSNHVKLSGVVAPLAKPAANKMLVAALSTLVADIAKKLTTSEATHQTDTLVIEYRVLAYSKDEATDGKN